MNAGVKTFLDFALYNNAAFVLSFGLLVPIATGYRVKQSFTAGLKHAVLLTAAAIAGTAATAIVPVSAGFVEPIAMFVVAVIGCAVIRAWGELPGEWAGMPKALLSFAPLVGIQLYLRDAGLGALDGVIAAFGAGVGYYIAIVLVAITLEQLRLSEASSYAKGLGTLLFAAAVFAMAFAGFRFL